MQNKNGFVRCVPFEVVQNEDLGVFFFGVIFLGFPVVDLVDVTTIDSFRTKSFMDIFCVDTARLLFLSGSVHVV